MLGGARDIGIVASSQHLPAFQRILGDGSQLGVRFSYLPQGAPRGIADALVAADSFLAGERCILALGDNFFWGHLDFLRDALLRESGATLFAYPVRDPSRYGVVEVDAAGKPTRLDEKPTQPRSSLAVPGLYVLDGRAVSFARSLALSPRGELEIIDLLNEYLRREELHVVPLGRGMAWLDMGTPEGLLDASQLVSALQTRQGLSIGCIEEVAVRMGFVSHASMRAHMTSQPSGAYRSYVESLLAD
jgi:glucose-1-phosphate thymidylyltransferase